LSKRYFRRDEIVGKDIISDSAVRLGKVKDIGYDPEGKIVLIYDKTGEGGEEAIPSSQIIAMGDVILVKSATLEKIPTPASSPSLKICPKCGKENAPDMLYCTSCGSRLGG
jgi:sporulation protein YlmC with PRC-barrel domain